MDSNSTLYAAQVDLTTVLINEYPWVDGIDGDLITLREWSVMDTVTLNPEFSDTLGFGRFEPSLLVPYGCASLLGGFLKLVSSRNRDA